MSPSTPRDSFVEASLWHGPLEPAAAILAAHPDIARADIYIAAILGDAESVRGFIARDAASATAKGGARGWDALTYLCFSKFLRLDPARLDGFIRAATALLDAGANPNTGFHEEAHQPNPEWESALYGAAGVAQNAALTRLLLARGADPNDAEVPYHAPETYDLSVVEALVESGKLNADSLATMLLRKADWHDWRGTEYLLAHGADPNRMTPWHVTALQHAIRRDNDLSHIRAMLDHGGDPLIENGADGRTAVAMAARRGRRDLLDLFEARGIPDELRSVDRLIGACAKADEAAIRAIVADDPATRDALLAEGGTLLAEFSGTANADGVRCLLDLGVKVTAPYEPGDPYFGIARDSTALHVAAWRAAHDVVALLIARGAPVNALDGRGVSPLALAVKACVDSYWTRRRSPESVRRLLEAGAWPRGVSIPTGYDAVDELLRQA